MMFEPIPGPKGLPLVGNLLDIWSERAMPLQGLERFADIYGPIYQISVRGQRRIICSSASLQEELTNEKRFLKLSPQVLLEQPGAKFLFVADNADPDWSQAHKILMPAFAPLAIQDMFDDMKDIASQLVLSWVRKGPNNRILVTEDFTKLTLDTIALCTMSYRFNSFYTDTLHPFVEAMNYTFKENTAKTTRPSFISSLMIKTNERMEKARKVLQDTGRSIIQDRKAHPVDKNDMLNTMIYGKDASGNVMREELIVAEMVGFLIAGHETTSGMLSFAMMQLLKNPKTYLKAQREVDEVIGNRAIEVTDISKLKYINAVLREASRLSPTAPVLQKKPNPANAHETELLGGKYKVESTDQIILLLSKAQKDPKVWGEDAADFDPERMLDENFDKMSSQYPGCWKPFGNGKRACIGRTFAWQEAVLVLAVVLQNFDVRLDNPNYQPVITLALTIKPKDLYIRVTPRKTVSVLSGPPTPSVSKELMPVTNGVNHEHTKPMLVLYGSNTGTCQAFAQRLSAEAAGRGFDAHVFDLDHGTNNLPTGQPVVIMASSYEGQPPDNAAKFVSWLSTCKPESLTGVTYSVFGCGHRDWTSTFHRIPKLIDELLQRAGATRETPIGLADAAKGDMYGDFEDWLDKSYWTHFPADVNHEKENPIQVTISTQDRAANLRYDVSMARVTENYILTGDGEPTKCHMEIELPPDTSYECGDYLAVLPLNSDKTVNQVMARFELPRDAIMTVQGSDSSIIPINTPLPVSDVLRSYVELSQPTTKKTLKILATYAEDPMDASYMENLANEDQRFQYEIVQKRTSIMNVLMQRPSVKVPFGEFITLLPPLRVRQYSISSSPLAKPGSCTLTYGVINATSLSNPVEHFEGVTGTYMESLRSGDSIQVSVRPTAKKTFRLPADPENTPIIMFGAGTGIAPFRGFLEERAMQLTSGRKLAPALLFLGCRNATKDRLYAQQMDDWINTGVVDVRYAFSKEKEASHGCLYVPDRMALDAEDVVRLWRDGARVYVCGARKFSDGVRDAARQIAVTVRDRETGRTEDELQKVEARFREALQTRLASDVFD